MTRHIAHGETRNEIRSLWGNHLITENYKVMLYILRKKAVMMVNGKN
jgi:hypothetical protein